MVDFYKQPEEPKTKTEFIPSNIADDELLTLQGTVNAINRAISHPEIVEVCEELLTRVPVGVTTLCEMFNNSRHNDFEMNPKIFACLLFALRANDVEGTDDAVVVFALKLVAHLTVEQDCWQYVAYSRKQEFFMKGEDLSREMRTKVEKNIERLNQEFGAFIASDFSAWLK